MNTETFIFTTDHKENAIVTDKLKDAFKKYKLQLYNFKPKVKSFEVIIREIK